MSEKLHPERTHRRSDVNNVPAGETLHQHLTVKWPCSFPDRPRHNPALPLGLRVFGVDRTGSHRTCGHPPLPPREQRFRPSRRSLFFRDRRFRASPLGMATVPTPPTPYALQCLGLGWSGSSQDQVVPRVRGRGVSPPTQGEAGQVEGQRSPRQPRPPRPAADHPKGSREPHFPT